MKGKNKEAELIPVTKYMAEVNGYFDKLEAKLKIYIPRQVFVATDEVTFHFFLILAIEQMLKNYISAQNHYPNSKWMALVQGAFIQKSQ